MKVFLLFALFAFSFASVEQSAACSVCQLVVSTVETYLASNATEQQIVQQLDQVCNLLGPLGTTCQAFAQQYVPQLIQWIEQNENPKQFCSQVGLCSSFHKAAFHHPKKLISPKRDTQQGACSVCQLVVQYVESYLASNQTEQQIIQQLDQVCNLLGPLGSTCQAFVNQYVPQLIQWIESGETPAQFCAQVGLCSSFRKSGVVHAHAHKRDAQQGACSVCQLVVQYVESYLASNQTEQQIIQQLDQVCGLLGPLGSTCQAFVNQYVPQLIQWIESGETPAQFCAQVGLCSSVRNVHHKRESQQGGCSVCQLVVQYVESYLASNQTEQQIIQQLDQVCSLLGPLSSTCQAFVNQYVPQLIQWIENGESPQQFCTQVGLCSSFRKPGVTHKRDAQQGACSVCQLVVQYVESYLASNQTEQQIIQQLDQVCGLLGPLGSTCQAFVNQYVPQLIQWIESGETPAQFCAQVGLCSSVRDVHHKRDVQQAGCSVCQLVVQYVEAYLASNQTEQQIIQQLDQVCTLLGPLSSTCQAFVNQYVPQLIQWIENGESPQQFCTQVGLCSSVVKQFKKSGTSCSLCQLAVTYLENYLQSATAQAEIEAGLNAVCQKLPAALANECVNLVDAYLPQLVGWVVQHQTPQVVCLELDLC